MWYIPSERFMKADSFTALRQLNERLAAIEYDRVKIDARRKKIAAAHRAMRARGDEEASGDTTLTPAFVVRTLRGIIDDNTVILNEAITSSSAIERHLPRTRPGTLFMSGGSSLGWHGGRRSA
jgi:acetolactate synthase-1/2/3 large subunit